MIISTLFPKWLTLRFAQPRPRRILNPQLKVRQVLPTLPKGKRTVPRLQDDNGPAGYRIQWRL